MKRILYAISFLLLMSNSISHAKVWRVNNNDPTADFNNTDVAHDSEQVVDGDTLYVEGSVDAYANFSCSKQLTIIGPGYFLQENRPSATLYQARISEITFVAGSEGSRVIGMTFDVFSSSAVSVNTDFISIERCYMTGAVDIGSVTGIRIVGNYLRGISGYFSSTVFDQVVLSNNIVTGNISLNPSATVVSCYNNIFLGNSYTFRVVEFRNNIVTNGSATLNLNSSIIERNIGSNNIFGGDNINVNNIDDLFIGGESPDGRYQLADNSLALGAGVGGVDCGIFGGDDLYIISGLPPIPIIKLLEVDDAASVETGLKVKIKVNSN